MKIREVATLLTADVFIGEKQLDSEVDHAFSSDLMSDVLANSGRVDARAVLLTGLSNYQVIRTAEMLDIKVVIFVRGKMPTEDMLELAMDNDMVILRTHLTMYNASGVLYSHGLLGIQD
jgi:hypothetical protein